MKNTTQRYSVVVDYKYMNPALKVWDRTKWFIIRKEYPEIRTLQYEVQNENELLNKIASDFVEPISKPGSFSRSAYYSYDFKITHIFLNETDTKKVDMSHLIEQLNKKIQTKRNEPMYLEKWKRQKIRL